MSSSTAAPLAIQRRRTTIACKICRGKKLRCITSEQPPKNPCARCKRKNLACEYVSLASEAREVHGDDQALPRSSSIPPLQWVPQAPPYAGFIPPPSGSGEFPPPSLPYTRPPPPNHRPRYSGGAQYPDLSLSALGPPSNQSWNPEVLPVRHASYHSPNHHAVPSYPHAYGAHTAAGYRDVWQGSQTAPGFQPTAQFSHQAAPSPPGYGQMAIPPMPFFADISSPEDESQMFNAANTHWPPTDGGA
ncbi:hypothetical protein B0H16DRAFT_1785623 [Mycena metata]|uniref:Zn(2)-C6 fungal-type domain-containing protein n=1 Tax=Mycena metata TaxID=1033252 RepID=A0AAD7HPS4_9AGAR|nr:hypothetical protein B0H16DRAFT_1785623 [Mycena metata]